MGNGIPLAFKGLFWQNKFMNNDAIPILLDTDIGTDIDDAIGLAYLLRQPRCRLLGVTTVTGQPQTRAALADAICRAAGRTDVPIHAGQDVGINLGVVQPECDQAAILSRHPHRPPESFRPYTALGFLREQIRAHPGEITLLTVGPLTNIGLLFTLDPELPRLLKRLVMMGGVFTWSVRGCPREWNVRCDPIASSIVFKAPVPELVAIGLDVTTQCRMPTAEAITRFREIGGHLNVVADAAEIWSRKGRTQITFHDPLAAAVVFQPDLCEYLDGRVEIELKSDRLAGASLFDGTAADKPHRIAHRVKPDAFLNHYFQTLAQ